MNQSTQRIIRNKIGLLNLAEELGNVSKACQMMGVSRDTFYRYRSARDDGGVEALLEKPRRKPNPKNRVEPQIEQAVLDFALEYPAHGQVRVSNEPRKLGVFVSPSGVRSVWLRHTLQSRKLRLKALEAKVAKEGIVLTEAQVAAMERQRSTDEAHGQIETEHPGGSTSLVESSASGIATSPGIWTRFSVTSCSYCRTRPEVMVASCGSVSSGGRWVPRNAGDSSSCAPRAAFRWFASH